MAESSFALPENTLIHDRYRILSVIGQGGYGITYKAFDTSLQRHVAIKECFPIEVCERVPETGDIRAVHGKEEDYATQLKKMMKEARTLAKLNKPGIVEVLDVLEDKGSMFIVMEWLDGGSLRDKMNADAPISLEISIKYLRYLLESLAFLHSKDIFHRDLKPENILFSSDADIPVIIDFGSALNRSSRTINTKTTMGTFTPPYAALEQITQGKIGAWTDLYTLAAIWYEVITGKRAAENNGTHSLSAADCRGIPYSDAHLKMILRNLSFEAKNRCQNAQEWLNALDKGDAAPVKKRKWKLIVVAVLLFLWVLGVISSPDEDTPEVKNDAPPPTNDSNQPALQDIKASLTDKVRKASRIAEFSAMCKKYCERADDISARRKEEFASLQSQEEVRLIQTKSAESAEQVMGEISQRAKNLRNKYESQLKGVRDDFYKELKSFGSIHDNEGLIADKYEPTTVEEASLLPLVSAALWNNEVYPAWNEANTHIISLDVYSDIDEWEIKMTCILQMLSALYSENDNYKYVCEQCLDWIKDIAASHSDDQNRLMDSFIDDLERASTKQDLQKLKSDFDLQTKKQLERQKKEKESLQASFLKDTKNFRFTPEQIKQYHYKPADEKEAALLVEAANGIREQIMPLYTAVLMGLNDLDSSRKSPIEARRAAFMKALGDKEKTLR